jgi:hypothetical protein
MKKMAAEGLVGFMAGDALTKKILSVHPSLGF